MSDTPKDAPDIRLGEASTLDELAAEIQNFKEMPFAQSYARFNYIARQSRTSDPLIHQLALGLGTMMWGLDERLDRLEKYMERLTDQTPKA